ncbi:MAG: CDP-alcohol phosphatidyltransferase family protein [Nanoarchaeota archaeon]
MTKKSLTDEEMSKGKKSEKIEEKLVKGVKNQFVLNVPNTLTLGRLVFTFVLAYLIFFNYSFILIGILFLLASVTDWFDGFFARRLNQKTDLGARLDQVIDRVFMIPLVILLIFKMYYINQQLAYLFLICLSREIIGAPGLVIRIIRDVDAYKVKYIGKVSTFIQSAAVFVLIIAVEISELNVIAWILAIATGLVGVVAGFDYLRDSLR